MLKERERERESNVVIILYILLVVQSHKIHLVVCFILDEATLRHPGNKKVRGIGKSFLIIVVNAVNVSFIN
jgi:hypothetical protein